MRVNHDIIDTVVTYYMQALMADDHHKAAKLYKQLRNYNVDVVVEDLANGVIEWYRKDETSI